MGATFVQRMEEDTGEFPSRIAKAYSIGREVLDARVLWADIDALDQKVPESAQIAALSDIWHLQRNMTRWLLNAPGKNLDIAAMVERYGAPMQALRAALPKILPAESQASMAADQAKWQAQGLPVDLSLAFASLPYLTYALDIIEIALERRIHVVDVAQTYFALSDALHSKWLMDNVEKLPVDGRWHAQARGVLRDELQSQQRALTGIVLAHAKPGMKPEAVVAEWLSRDDAALKHTLSMFADMRNLRGMDYPTLSVAVRRLAQIAATDTRAG